MYRLEREDFVSPPYLSLWGLLGFQAGFINGFGLLAVGRVVSHVTGFGTQIGVALGQGLPMLALELIGMPILFMLGAFTSSFFTIARIEAGHRPNYSLIATLMPLIITIVMASGLTGEFGSFGEPLVFARDFALLYLLSFICGMQNGCFATLTKGQIRTTHLTGITTDIGTDLARVWFGKLKAEEKFLTKQTNAARLLTFVSFSVGSVISVLATRQFEHAALSVPLLSSAIVCLAVHRICLLLDARAKAEIDARSTPTIVAPTYAGAAIAAPTLDPRVISSQSRRTDSAEEPATTPNAQSYDRPPSNPPQPDGDQPTP